MEKKALDYILVPLGLLAMVAYHLWLLYQIMNYPNKTVIGINTIHRSFWVCAMMEVILFLYHDGNSLVMRCLIIHLFIHCVYCLANKSYCYNSVSLSRRIKFISLSLSLLPFYSATISSCSYIFLHSISLTFISSLREQTKGLYRKTKGINSMISYNSTKALCYGEKSA